MTSSTCATGTFALFTASITAVAPSWGAGTSARPPRYLPIGVRTAASKNASAMGLSLCCAGGNDIIKTNYMLLRTEHLTKNYGRLCALDHLALEVQPGEIVGILGPNGSGKSTALRLLLGFLKPTSGHASIGGHDCWRDSVQARRQVAYLPGELRLYENMTGRQLVRFLSQLRQQMVRDDVEKLATRLDLDLDRPIAQLSSGMKRKVALLQVLLPGVPLLMMDEPTNTLDPTMRDELLAQLLDARQRGQAVLFSSHVLTEVERVCDRVAILRQG